MTVDEAILKSLERGPVTINKVLTLIEPEVRRKLDKLRVRGVVLREGRGGSHRQYVFTLVNPDRAAEALNEKGGGLALTKKKSKEP